MLCVSSYWERFEVEGREITFQWLPLLLRIHNVQGSVFGLEACSSNSGVSWNLSVPTCFISHPSNTTVHDLPLKLDTCSAGQVTSLLLCNMYYVSDSLIPNINLSQINPVHALKAYSFNWLLLCSAIFLLRKGSGKQRVTPNSVGEGWR